jgi:nitroimidazol reductase NimA-like FMN-containing flavoprotein (pyridoxamine 5'-phosphate oxidase superfamily)
MAIATLRTDGWPQTTTVGYANEGILIYFAISRVGQKFQNISRDDRVSIAVGRDFHDPKTITGISMAAHASEVTDPKQRERALKLLLERHPGLNRLEGLDLRRSAIMRAAPQIVTVLDYSQGFGHSDLLTVGPDAIAGMTEARDDDWGFGTALKRPS